MLDSSCVFRTYIFHYGLGGGAWEITVVVVDHFQSPQLFHTTGHLALDADEPWQDRGNLAVSAPSERSRLELYYGPNRLGPQLLPDSQAPPVRRGYLCRCRLPSNPEDFLSAPLSWCSVIPVTVDDFSFLRPPLL